MEISPEDLIQSLETGNSVVVNLPTLRYLLKVLPDPEEVEHLFILVPLIQGCDVSSFQRISSFLVEIPENKTYHI